MLSCLSEKKVGIFAHLPGNILLGFNSNVGAYPQPLPEGRGAVSFRFVNNLSNQPPLPLGRGWG